MPEERNDLTFSQRMGLTPVRKVLQIDSMDRDLRIRLWNLLHEVFWKYLLNEAYFDHVGLKDEVIAIWKDHLKHAIDDLPKFTTTIVKEFRAHFFNCQWHEVYEFVEFAVSKLRITPYFDRFNKVLEQEQSGYRFVGERLVPITSEQEIATVEAAVALFDRFKPVSDHLKSALEKLSDRTSPDYRNSIKES